MNVSLAKDSDDKQPGAGMSERHGRSYSGSNGDGTRAFLKEIIHTDVKADATSCAYYFIPHLL